MDNDDDSSSLPRSIRRVLLSAGWFRGFREVLGCSQRRIADTIGVSRGTIAHLERGRLQSVPGPIASWLQRTAAMVGRTK